MAVSGLHHYTLRCVPDELPALHDFYTRVIGLSVGPRPDIPAPGHWLYAGGRPIVHLYAHLSDTAGASGPPDADGAASDAPSAAGQAPAWVTGPLDHISFHATDVEGVRRHLRALGVPFEEAPVPGWPLHQVFVRDPKGLKIEMTFDLGAEAADGSNA
jgi:catechol 2,3-dioxygenase-like lactoylglutathione lyase family enzyme